MDDVNKPLLRSCRFCSKQVQNLGMHIANNHPSILEKLEESEQTTPPIQQNTSQNVSNVPISRSTSELIREKLNTMLDIQIIKMLSTTPNMTPADINKMMQPQTPNLSIKELKEFHDLVYPDAQNNGLNVNVEGEGTNWMALISQALPIILQMLPNKKAELEQNVNTNTGNGTTETGSAATIRPIQEKVAEFREQPSSTSEEPRINVSTIETINDSGSELSK